MLAGVWLVVAVVAAQGAILDFSPAFLLQDAELATVRPDTLDQWMAPDGRMHFSFMPGAQKRAVWLGGKRDKKGLDIQALGLPVYEVQAIFRQDESLESLEMVLFSRGDVVRSGAGGHATLEAAVHDEKAFRTLCAQVIGRMEEALGKAARHRTQRPVQHHEQRQFLWVGRPGSVVLSIGLTEERGTFKGEYIRVRVMPALPDGTDKGGPGFPGTAASGMAMPGVSRSMPPMRQDAARITARKGSLATHVVREEDGTIYVGDIPMVDQGNKGYCVVATLERLIRYYGGEVNQHELAQLCDTGDGGGTGVELGRLVSGDICRKYRFKRERLHVAVPSFEKVMKRHTRVSSRKIVAGKSPTVEERKRLLADTDKGALQEAMRHFPEYKSFMKTVRHWTEKGIPLVWLVPGHMRLLIGCNEATGEVVYSDSWGEGHEYTRMSAPQALMMTQACFAVYP